MPPDTVTPAEPTVEPVVTEPVVEDIGNLPVTSQNEEQFVTEAFNSLEDIDLPADPSQDEVPEVVVAPTPAPVAPVVATPAVEPSPAVVTPPVVTPAPVAVAPGAPTPEQQAAATPQPVVQVPSAAAPAQPTGENDPFRALSDRIKQHEAEFVQQLATEQYALAPDDVNAFLTGDASKISLAMARVHANVQRSTMAVISAQMPKWIFGMMSLKKASDDREEQFWNANKHLDKTQHKEVVKPLVQLYMKQMPQATPEQIDRVVGHLAAVQLGLPMQAQAAQTPQTPAVVTPGRQVRTVAPGFVPAGTQPATAPNGAQPQGTWVDQLFDQVRAEDQGLFDT